MAPREERESAARQVLDAAGIAAPVRATGIDGEVAAVTGSPALRERLAALAPTLRDLGFQYVALDIDDERRTNIRDT